MISLPPQTGQALTLNAEHQPWPRCLAAVRTASISASVAVGSGTVCTASRSQSAMPETRVDSSARLTQHFGAGHLGHRHGIISVSRASPGTGLGGGQAAAFLPRGDLGVSASIAVLGGWLGPVAAAVGSPQPGTCRLSGLWSGWWCRWL